MLAFAVSAGGGIGRRGGLSVVGLLADLSGGTPWSSVAVRVRIPSRVLYAQYVLWGGMQTDY